MTHLIVCHSSEPAVEAYINKLVEKEPWERVYLITSTKGLRFRGKSVKVIEIEPKEPLKELVEQLKKELSKASYEIAFNIIGGDGKTHMAVISALLKLGLGIRLVALTKEGLEEV